MTTPLIQKDFSDQIQEAIEERILSGNLLPGERLHQEHLAGHFGVSRTIILKVLHRMGRDLLVESRPRRGFYVRRFEPPEIIELFECRLGIECVAVRLAARKISDVQVAELRRLLKPFQGSAPVDRRRYDRANRAFHNRILEISGNLVLSRLTIIGNILVLAGAAFRDAGEQAGLSHLEILDALERRDEEAAVSAMRDHLEVSLNQLRASFLEEPTPPASTQPEMEPSDDLPIEIL